MLNLRLSEIALWTHGGLHGADAQARGVSTDTRKLAPGELFVAIEGERHDGHEHLAQAVERGAAGAMVMRRIDVGLPQVVVADTVLALGDLASAVRAQRRARVAGITGSNGKTTVKTLAASILQRAGPTHSNAGNLNNEIGLPLSLLAMPENARYAVLEMGAGKPGDIAYLAAIARPEVGLVNNIASAHLERMGSLEGVAETKGALYQALPADGTAVINADDAFEGFFTGLAGARRVLRFGFSGNADVRAEAVETRAEDGAFTLVTPQGSQRVHLPLPGRHSVANALAAAAIAHALDVPLAVIAAGLENATAVGGRLQRRAAAGGWHVIDDSYNANPGSTAAAIETLALQAGERWLVLGDMAELGANAAVLHAQIGERARDAGVDALFSVGALSAHAARAFGTNARHFATQPELVAALREALRPGVTVLVKGSRSSAMERVVAGLLDGNGGGTRHAA
ncbi:MAG TPA: UDP-N-acetylmuramoyl-tripeptide--D-alanyl-D-alanine ligase [Rhodanobacteraceae bacterium]|nr:UDP-N-acetylmuramoyl-tripeptide--D-alanyl-D-alanine ligase [Rhodanobacteraceae bacterium]